MDKAIERIRALIEAYDYNLRETAAEISILRQKLDALENKGELLEGQLEFISRKSDIFSDN